MEIKIEKDIPIPESPGRRGGKAEILRKTLLAMKIGDSFICANEDYHSLRAATTSFNNDHNEENYYSVRKIDNKTRRCWRIK